MAKIGNLTTNQRRALRALLDLDLEGVTTLEIRGDSQVVIRQMTGAYTCSAPSLQPLHQEALDLAGRLPGVTFRWIPRNENERADELSREAFEDQERAQGADGYAAGGDPVAVPLTRAAGWLE